MKEQMKESAYKSAGVDIDAAADLIEQIKPAVKLTNRSGVMSGLGGFGAMFDPKAAGYNDPVLVSSTDGVGTKIKIAIDCNIHDTIGIDAVAMCVNDLIVQGAEPLFFLDYFATGKLENNVASQVISSIARGCEIAGCALIGGETAEMPGLYAPGDYDIAGFTVGAVEREKIITGEKIRSGDVVLGIASNGIHSNGFSLVRKIVKESKEYNYENMYDALSPFDMNIRHQASSAVPASEVKSQTLAQALLAPTRIYVKPLLRALKIEDESGAPAIHGMAHITGGGLLENIPRILPEDIAVRLDTRSWNLPPVFGWLKDEGNLSCDDLARTLNCGIGMVVICDPAYSDDIKKALEKSGETVYTIGNTETRNVLDESVILDQVDTQWA